MFKSAQSIIDIIEQRKNRGYGLEHFREYMASIQNPQQQLRSIHVAGTNGKGSTVNDLRSILQEANYRVGTFTSPYMITHLDRIRINDQFISEQEFLDIANEFYDSWIRWDLSMFEIDMCIACIYFTRKQVDVAVFEVGLGGRLDSTNILDPMVSVITNIGMDHMELLGDTPEKIAIEKAGIIKSNKAVITAEETMECLRVFEARAKECHSACIHIKEIANISIKDAHVVFDYDGMRTIELASGARYQCRNAALAIETIRYLNQLGEIKVDERELRTGLAKAVWIGRFEVVHRDPLIVLDGAHNADGIAALCDSLKDINDLVIIFSVLRDKNFEIMLEELQTISDTILLTPQHNERALDVHVLENKPGVYVMDSIAQALQKAKETGRPIVITGSLYFISEVRAGWFS